MRGELAAAGSIRANNTNLASGALAWVQWLQSHDPRDPPTAMSVGCAAPFSPRTLSRHCLPEPLHTI